MEPQSPTLPPHVAYVFVIRPPVPVREYAQMTSEQCHWFMDEAAGGFVLRGVRWAVAMKDSGTVVAAALDPNEKELAWLRQHTVELEADQYYKGGRPVPMGHNGLP